ncbi:MAG TPA: heat-inducible transcriptional repressor HrcA [Acidimicrobiales bacterium]|jgi:heat-inducible transcriptional repressor
MLDERKAAILRAVVEEYIETAQPVGSSHVASARGVDVSSATIRHEMAQLEADGYLLQPHTSAGRVPTEKGYRFFVDHLRSPIRLPGRSAEQVRAFFDRAHGEVEEMLAETSRLLSNLTALTSVVVSPTAAQTTIRSVQLVGLSATAALVVLVLSDGTVEKHAIHPPEEVGDERLGAATAHLSAHLAGAPRTRIPMVPGTGDEETDLVMHRAIAVMSEPPRIDVEQVYVGGTARLAEAFDAIETVRAVLGILEQQLVVVTLVRDVLDRGLQVAIGSETGVAPLADCALVVATYEIEGERLGTIGVLGPTRMNYPQALAAVAVVSDRLSDRMADGD